MTLDDYLEKYAGKLNYLQNLFIREIFYRDYGEPGLDLIVPEVPIDREDGSARVWRIDFVVTSPNNKKYGIELHGYHAHDPNGRLVTQERFSDLQSKNNLINQNFDSYIELTTDQLEEKNYAIHQLRRLFKSDQSLFDLYLNRGSGTIQPNEVQEVALERLDEGRSLGHKTGLIILATGLGKTFLSGFDIQATKSKRVLFVAHVVNILLQTKNGFEDLMKDRINEMELFSTNSLDSNKNIFFATVQAIARKQHLVKFPKDFFDYIVIDEAHHAAARTYQALIDYFEPKSLLGLTATPFRGDEKDVMSCFGDNVFYEMNQEQAIKEGYLADIEYMGFHDNVDYSDIKWNGSKYDIDDLNRKLMISERDKSIIDKYQIKSNASEKTIGFCTSIEHADYMSDVFNKAGITSIAIHSKSESSRSRFSSSERDTLLQRFKDDEFEVAFTVNMFNEGVDIPDVSTILMLRPTDSLTIFIQQIGRGLRLANNKKCLKVLDFIGNYRTANITLDGLGITLDGLKHDAEKDIYYYDNNGKCVIFEAEIIQIFKRIISRQSKTVDLSKIEQRWQDYADFLDQSTRTDEDRKNSVTNYWQVDKKNKNISAHLWAIDFYIKNYKNHQNLASLDRELKKAASASGFKIEGARALFFSKLLGIITTDSPFLATDVYENIACNPSDQKAIVSSQMEKLYYRNDIYSDTNRHATDKSLASKKAIFSVYPILYIYQILVHLFLLDERPELTRFELEHFIFFSKNHDQLDEVVENIISFRHHEDVDELEKLLKLAVRNNKKIKKYNIFDTRYFSILSHVECLSWNENKVKLKDDYVDIIIDKVNQFDAMRSKHNIFYENDFSQYYDLLYSKKTIFEYYSK